MSSHTFTCKNLVLLFIFVQDFTLCQGGCCQESGTDFRAIVIDKDKFIRETAILAAELSSEVAVPVPGCCKAGPPGTCNWRRDCCNLGTGGYWVDDADYDPATGFCESYAWNEPAWGTCSSDCGEGVEQRITPVACIRSRDGASVSDERCANAGPRPHDTRPCLGSRRCGYGFVGEPWGACSVQCGDGVQQRAISCVRSDGERVTSEVCEARGYTRPASEQGCSTIVGCSYFFAASPWSTCNTACVQFRELTCMRSDGTQAEEYFCSSLPNLPTSQACC